MKVRVISAAEQVERLVDQLWAWCDVLDESRPYPCRDASQLFPCVCGGAGEMTPQTDAGRPTAGYVGGSDDYVVRVSLPSQRLHQVEGAMGSPDLRPMGGASPNGTLPLRPAALPPGTLGAPSAPERRALSRGERAVAVLLGVMLTALGVLGFVVSFRSVERAVRPSFGSLAWSAPIGIDLGIAVFTGLDLFLAHLGMRMRALRLLPWGLVAVTVALNVAEPLERGDMIGAVSHGVLPVLWITAVEVTTHVVRHRAGLGQTGEARRAAGRMDRIRMSRYLLAPFSTLRIRRLMILWEERSYDAARERWKAKRRARAQMAKRHGLVAWRWKAPIDQRLDYRDADYTRSTIGPGNAPRTSAPSLGPGAPVDTATSQRQRRAPSRPTDRPSRPAGDADGGRRRVSNDELVDELRTIAAAYADRGETLTARASGRELRMIGIEAGNGRVTKALAVVRDGHADGQGSG